MGKLRAPPPPLPARRDRPLGLRDAGPPLTGLAGSLPSPPRPATAYLGRGDHKQSRGPFAGVRLQGCGVVAGKAPRPHGRVWLGGSVLEPEPVPPCSGPEGRS